MKETFLILFLINLRRWIFPCNDTDNKISEVTQEVQTQQTLLEKVQELFSLLNYLLCGFSSGRTVTVHHFEGNHLLQIGDSH